MHALLDLLTIFLAALTASTLVTYLLSAWLRDVMDYTRERRR